MVYLIQFLVKDFPVNDDTNIIIWLCIIIIILLLFCAGSDLYHIAQLRKMSRRARRK